MSQRTAERLQDLLKWRNEHKRDSMGVPERQTFQETVIDNLLNTLVDIMEDVADLEGKPRESIGRRIWTTQGMTVRGDVRRLG